MKVSGIVCEYNPFHNGHLHHIEQTRKNGADRIICVMSGNFVQRGDVAILDKFTRAELAVMSGADLVIELPVQYCLSSAENFASAAVFLLENTGIVNEISFGSESGNIQDLINASEISDKLSDSAEIRELMKKGYTYPKAFSEILKEKNKIAYEIFASPNNILAIEYLKALRRFDSHISPFTVKREGAFHDSSLTADNIASASYIRKHLEIAGKYVPELWAKALDGETASLERLERVIMYKIRTSTASEIADISDIPAGLAERIIAAGNATSLDGIFEAVKTKAFTMARVKRTILSLLIGITKADMAELPPYIRILAFNRNGRELMKAMKTAKKIPVGTSLADLRRINPTAERFALLESRGTDIYNLTLKVPGTTQTEFRKKITENLCS